MVKLSCGKNLKNDILRGLALQSLIHAREAFLFYSK